MANPIIRAENLGKRYRIGQRERYLTLRDVIGNALRSRGRRLRSPALHNRAELWALKECSFDVCEGEALGLIGRNGAGKTTLLKILSRITRPTTGWAEISGRVGSLLEVGTGFHPELTGRENTFLSGAILGMRKREISRKFEEIVAFADLEKFIDTPVKHYSSGMHVRLAFAVAAHLDPEILLVDEVLAVGDINFQRKCLDKMNDVARAGRTIVLVSHQLNQIRRLCSRVIWVDNGCIRLNGPTHEVVAAYESAMGRNERGASLETRSPGAACRFMRWEVAASDPGRSHIISTLDSVTVSCMVDVGRHVSDGQHGVALFNADRQLIWARAEQNLFYRAGFAHAYRFSVQPDHPDYFARRRKPRIRTILAASHTPLDSKLLVRTPEPTSPVHPCSLLPRRRATDAAEEIIRFAKKPLPEKVRLIRRMVSGEVDR